MKPLFLLSLAGRNLCRYRRRTVLTMLVLAVGIACYILMDSLLIGTRRESELALIYYEMGEARLVTPGWWADRRDYPLSQNIPEPDRLMEELAARNIPSSARTEFTATAVTHTGIGGSFPVVVTALDPREDTRVNRLTETVSEGTFPAPGSEDAALGEWLAKDMNLSLGDTLTLQFTDRWGSREAMDVTITALLNSPNHKINRSGLFIPRDTAQDYLSLEGSASYVQIGLPALKGEKRRALTALETLAAAEKLEYHGWRDWSADYLAMADGDTYSSAVILFLVFIIASVGLANTMLMSVMERQQEIGMMRSLGMKERAILLLFLCEGGLIGFLGSLIGLFLSFLGNIPLVRKGIDFSFMMRDIDMGYRFTGIIHGVWSAPSYLWGLAAGILICLTVSWLTVHRVLARPITEEIRAA